MGGQLHTEKSLNVLNALLTSFLKGGGGRRENIAQRESAHCCEKEVVGVGAPPITCNPYPVRLIADFPLSISCYIFSFITVVFPRLLFTARHV